MTGSIVDHLAHWLADKRAHLIQAGIEIVNRLPQQPSNVPWKATVGLIKDNIFVSYTVWERTEYQSELIIVDGLSGETLRSEDATPKHPDEIDATLNAVVNDLISRTYRRINR